MNRKFRQVFLLVTLIVMLSASVQVAGASKIGHAPGPKRPAPHPPVCTVTISNVYLVTCEDKGRDIDDVFIIFRGSPLKHDITWNGASAQIVVQIPTIGRYPFGQKFIWCVRDASGNLAFGSYPR